MDKKIKDFIDLFQSYFRKPAQILSLKDFFLELEEDKNFFYLEKSQKLFFPVMDSKENVVFWVLVCSVETDKSLLFRDMISFLDSTIVRYIKMKEVNQVLKQREAIQQATYFNNVIPFRSSLNAKLSRLGEKNEPFLESSKLQKFMYESDFKKIHLVSPRPLWINGSSKEILRLVSYLHSESKNWALLTVGKDIELIWKDTHFWQEFPQTTIVILDLEKLSQYKKRVLEKNLQALEKLKGPKPLVIVTSNRLKKPLAEFDKSKYSQLRELLWFYSIRPGAELRIQAQYLLFQLKKNTNSTYYCFRTRKFYFLPLSLGSKNFH